MSNYAGYLLKFKNTVMPNKYFTSYSSTPNQRLEADAERDNNGNLKRTTLPNTKTSIKFTTHILHLNDKINFQKIIMNSFSNTLQRKCSITYWNDETNSYKTADFYVPDITYEIFDASDDDVKYNPITVELIQY